jgi:two-component system, response regulator, stage 0 sporulation protein F
MSDLLLVDNDPRIAELLAFFLAKRGHTVRTAKSFTEARGALAVREPDLMLSDLDLGGERGEEELPKLAREGLLPPTLVVSGYLDVATERALSAIPAILGTLRKPFDLSTLEARVQRALDEVGRARAGVARPAADPGEGSDEDGWTDVAPFSGGTP